MIFRLEDEPRVLPGVSPLPRDGKTQFKRHVEARHWPLYIDFNAREIMDRVWAALNQLKRTVEPAFAAGDFERRSRLEVEHRQACDVGKEEIHEVRVIGNIQKD